jgi:quercetin dioxygenase-like cupin family protein
MESSERLREHPERRFAELQHPFDLDAEMERLKQESPAGEEGHRQRTLYKHGSTTVAIFAFDRLTRLPPHRTNGVVIIQVLKGHLQVTSAAEAHDLHAGQLLTLAPQVEHQVVAYEESEMLLTVNLEVAAPSG